MLLSLTDLGGNLMMYGRVLFHCPNKTPFFSERLTELLDTAHLLRSPGPESTCSCFVPVATAHVHSFSFQGDTRCMEGPLFLMTSAFCGHCVTSAEFMTWEKWVQGSLFSSTARPRQLLQNGQWVVLCCSLSAEVKFKCPSNIR